MNRIPRQGEFYRHFKGNLYQVVAVAKHSETMEEMVVYQALYGTYGVYVRPLSMFVSEVDHQKYPEVNQVYRFEKVELSEHIDKRKDSEETTTFQVEKKEQPDINEDLLAFLDAQEYSQKLEILLGCKKRIDDHVLQTIAISLDFPLGEGDFNDHFGAIVYFLETHTRYEGRRLR